MTNIKYYLASGIAIITLSGCNDQFNSEKFDGSSSYNARVSYNRIFKELNKNERDNFSRQYALYSQPYLLENCSLGNKLCTVNRIKDLDGLPYKDVLTVVENFEISQKKIAAEESARAEAENKIAEINELKTLHRKWIQRTNVPIESQKEFKVEISAHQEYGRKLASWKIINSTQNIINSFHIDFDIIDHESEKVHAKFYGSNHSGKNIAPGETASGVIPRDDIQDYLNNKRYTVTGYITNVQLEGGPTLYERPDVDTYRYESLKKKYPDDFKSIQNKQAEGSDIRSNHPSSQEKSTGDIVVPEDAFNSLMRQFPKCMIENVYYDQNTNKASDPFFDEYRLTPYKVENDFAYYRLKTSYKGIPVAELMIPASNWDIRSITFNLPIHEARTRMEQVFGSQFEPSARTENGEAPELMKDHADNNRSVLVCTSPM